MLNPSVFPFLFRSFLSLALPPVASGLLLRWLRIDHWVIVLVAILSMPLACIMRIQWLLIRDRRAAVAIGATLAPTLQGQWPGNFDLAKRLIAARGDDSYLAEVENDLISVLGNTFNYRLLWENVIFTSEPDHIKTILASDFNNYEKGPKFRGYMYSVLGTGVFNSDGDMWKFHRSMTRPFFSRDRISDFELFDRHADHAISLMKERFRAGYPVNFQDLISRFTLDSATEFLFGHCVDSLSSGLPYPHNASMTEVNEKLSAAEEFARAFSVAQEVLADRSTIGWTWPFLEIFQDKTKPSMKIVDAYLGPILADAVEKARNASPMEGKNEIDEDATLLDHLVKHTLDPVTLHDEVLNILVAGRDTTASILTFVIYFLATHPDVLSRLRDEVLASVGATRIPTLEDVRDMKFLRAVINETLRLFPAVPFNERTSINVTTWTNPDPNGKPIYIPAGTTAVYSVFLMHRRKDLWGPDADEFDPDRFLDERLKKYLTPKPFIFLPFNAGPRICLGQQFAYNEISFFLIKLLQTVDSIALDPNSQPPNSRVPESWKNRVGRERVEQFRPRSHLTMYSYGGLWVKMNEAVLV